jgi:sugar-specific transcriptional regulator TrmB
LSNDFAKEYGKMSKQTESVASPQEGVLFNQILKEAMGISDPAAEAYKTLLAGGALTAGEISTMSGLDYAHTSKAVGELENERLIRRIPGVVERFTTIPPYGGFVAFLKDFQKIAKNMGDNATGIVESCLNTIDKNCGDWKKEAQQTGKSSIAQTTSEIDLFKEGSSKSASDMLEKMKQESESTKTMITEAIKKHVDDHKLKSGEVEEELSSGIDNVTTKFDGEAKKYLKDMTDTATTFLDNYRGTIQTFVETLRTSLQQYKTETKEGLAALENDLVSIQSALDEKARATVTSAKAKSSDVLESQRKTLAEKSLQLQSGIREETDRFMKTATSNLNKFKSSLDLSMKELSGAQTKLMSDFKEKTTASLDKWWSALKSGASDSTQQIYKSMDLLVNSLIREGEQLISFAKGMTDSYASRVKSSYDELKAKMEEATSTGLTNLTGAASAIKGTLSGIIANQLSSSQLMASFLESTLSTIIPSCSNALETVPSEVNKNTQRITSALSKSNDSTLVKISRGAVNRLSVAFPLLEREVNNVVERVIEKSSAAQIVQPSPKSTSKKSPGEMRKTAFTAEVKETLRALERKLIDEFKDFLNQEVKDGQATFAEEVKKLQTDTSSVSPTTLKSARSELGKGEIVASSLLPKFAEYSSSIEDFQKQITDMIDITIRQYAGEAEIAKKTLDDLILRQNSDLGETMKRINDSVAALRTSRTKELGELVGESHSNLDSALGKHLDELDAFVQQNKSNLQELVSHVAKAVEATKSSAQSSIANQVGPTLNTCKEITDTTTNSIRAAMISATEEFDKSTASLQKDLDEFTASSNEEIKSLAEESVSKVNERKETLSKLVEQKIGKATKELADASSMNIAEMMDKTATMNTSLTKATSTSIAEFSSEGLGAKDKFQRLVSSHLQDYEQEAFGAAGTCGYLLSRSYEKYRETLMTSQKNHSETLLAHRARYENSISTMNSTLVGCIDKNEALMTEQAKGMLTDFRNNIDRLSKVSASVEWVLQSAWMELARSQSSDGYKTWPIVTKAAMISHIQDMIKRTKSYIMMMLPTVSEAPLEEICKVKKATRVTLVVGEVKGEERQEQTLAEIAKMGNVSLRASPGLGYYGCSRDSEEILFTPFAEKDNELVGLASVEDGYVELFDKILAPALLGSSSDLKEPAKPQTVPRKPEK